MALSPIERRTDPRMVSGAVIANDIFFEILTPAREDGAFGLRATARHEVWLESTGQSLDALDGVVRISDAAQRTAQCAGRLVRTPSGYMLELFAAPETLTRADGRSLTATFDVEYQQSYESPGGYSEAHGVRYWDDVAYPVVEVARFDIR